ncbi:MAG: hypothetical protein R2941_00150 [Desulfobacterales bacterium]
MVDQRRNHAHVILVMTLPFFHALFQFCYVRPADIAYCLLAGFGCILLLEALKTRFMRKILGGNREMA